MVIVINIGTVFYIGIRDGEAQLWRGRKNARKHTSISFEKTAGSDGTVIFESPKHV